LEAKMFIIGYLLMAIAKILSLVINAYILIIIIDAVLSWVSHHNPNDFTRLIDSLVNPFLGQIRKQIPRFSIDISPIIAILILLFLKDFVVNVIQRLGEMMI